MGKRTARASMRARIIAVFMVSLLVYVLLISIFYWQMLDQTAQSQLLQGTRQSSDLLVEGILAGINNARNVGNSLLFNAAVMRWLDEDGQPEDLQVTREANRILTQTYVTFPGIESIYIFSNDGRSVSATRHRVIKQYEDFRDTTWYHRAVSLSGGSFISLNADDTLFSSQSVNYISFIRQLLNINTLSPVGFLIINISEKYISDTTSRISTDFGTDFLILDKNGASVIRGQTVPQWGGEIPPNGAVRQLDGETVFLFSTEIAELGWTVVSSTPYRLFGERLYEPFILLFPVLCAVGMYLFGSVYTSRLISKPIGKLIASMRGVREGRFTPVPPSERQDEFGQLNENYNIMIGALNTMIQQRVLLEKEKQRYELDILTEQFKPHFLYNTLDSISYLILSGDKQRAYEATTNLSRFFRTNLLRRPEVVPLSREIEMVRSYLALQKIRYGDLIDDRYEITPEAGEAPVLRNILQPLVENSIYHGIKPIGEPGLITVSARTQGDWIIICVADDGRGMTPETLADLKARIAERNMRSIGLCGTIKRLQLFYGVDDVCELTSEPGKGTSVLLKIPADAKEDIPDGTQAGDGEPLGGETHEAPHSGG